MKISDLIRLMPNNANVIIGEGGMAYQCDLDRDINCEDIDDETGCEECPQMKIDLLLQCWEEVDDGR